MSNDSCFSGNTLNTDFKNNPNKAFATFKSQVSNKSSEPALLMTLSQILAFSASKDTEIKNSADQALSIFLGGLSQVSAMVCLEDILVIVTQTTKWQVKQSCLSAIQTLVQIIGTRASELLPEMVPVVTDLMWSTKKSIRKAAIKTLKKTCKTLGNKDLEPFLPELVSALADPTQVLECVHKLAATTFVQTVDAGTLALVVPLLLRGFRERNIALTRKCAIICENMSKLVEEPSATKPFLPTLLPCLARAKEEISDAECRSVCERTHEHLEGLGKKIVTSTKSLDLPSQVPDEVVSHCNRLKARGGSNKDLQSILENYISSDEVSVAIGDDEANESAPDDNNEANGVNLCNCVFSLAYGSQILLNSARLKLCKGSRYGIIAQKSAGKTTLLKSIANYQVDGFPPASALKTVFVDTDVQGFEKQQDVSSYCQETTGIDEISCTEILLRVGFTDRMIKMPITSLSGGWRMKLALARAMLRKADILLMDEPTNHLDVLNVQWVVDYLTGDDCKDVTSLIVSHDTGFLDKVATDVIHLSDLKLSYHQGNMSAFVEKFPEAKSYYDLTKSSLKFSFPEPGPLSGVNSKGKTILQMQGVSFRYPSADSDQLKDVAIRCSMASRVACVGANGAGKSTMIKLLTGELEPTTGSVIKNPNMRFAYVAQHAFHHIEQHLSKTPNEYIQWRYSGGEDKEALLKSTTRISDEEKKKMEKPIEVIYEDEDEKKHKEKRVVEKVVSRRKTGKKLEYEIRWKNKSQDLNSWYERDYLEDLGFIKLLEELDRRLAAMEGSYARVLSQKNVEKHLENVGLERELGTHNRISSLSGGQKVKVVLGACTWCQPHLIILDEPTNYLDREALGALANAIKEFQGGVVLITHNKEFADCTTRETWVVANNRCDIRGDADWEKYSQEALELQQADDLIDAAGNKITLKKTPASLNPREKKKLIKKLKTKIKNDDEMTDFEHECATDWCLWE